MTLAIGTAARGRSYFSVHLHTRYKREWFHVDCYKDGDMIVFNLGSWSLEVAAEIGCL